MTKHLAGLAFFIKIDYNKNKKGEIIMPIEQKPFFEKTESEKTGKESIEEKKRQEINEKIYERMKSIIEHIRNAWMKGKPDVDWKERGYRSKEDEESKRKICEFEARTKEILADLMEKENIDFTRGYKNLTDSITGGGPETPGFKMIHREHSKFLGRDFESKFRDKLREEFELRRDESPGGRSELNYYKKDGGKMFSATIHNIYTEELELYKQEYQLGYGLEELLGGKEVRVEANTEIFLTPFAGGIISINIKEGIDYDPEKKWFIKPATAVKDVVGRLRIEKIPTITSDNEEWLKFYKE